MSDDMFTAQFHLLQMTKKKKSSKYVTLNNEC